MRVRLRGVQPFPRVNTLRIELHSQRPDGNAEERHAERERIEQLAASAGRAGGGEPAAAGDAGEPGRGRAAEPEEEGDAGELSGCSHTRHLFT